MSIEQLADAINRVNLQIIKFVPNKPTKCIVTDRFNGIPISRYRTELQTALVNAEAIQDFPLLAALLYQEGKFEKTLRDYVHTLDNLKDDDEIKIPEEYQNLLLNCDVSAHSRDKQFFMTDQKEYVSPISGNSYLGVCGMGFGMAFKKARRVIPEYLPRSKKGTHTRKTQGGDELTIFNTYVPPHWRTHGRPKDVHDALPKLFKKLVFHLFPNEEEREFFFHWLHGSLFERASTFLILCGAPGVGKNRLKLIMRALHGFSNTTDGKLSILRERFNAPLADCTLFWLDEIRYTEKEENVLKEMQNDTLSIERKGVDATRSTPIYASLVISNNKPRDNYLAFDARKFVALQLNGERLEVSSMTEAEIEEFNQKVGKDTSETYDPQFIAQIAMWIKRHGKSEKWKNYEYRGSMFWSLAHTSMSRWQKKAASFVLDPKSKELTLLNYNSENGFLWSVVEKKLNGDQKSKQEFSVDYTNVKYFFDSFRDIMGDKAFETKSIPKDLMGDFHVKPIKDAEIVTEAQVLDTQRSFNGSNKKSKVAQEDGEIYDIL